MSKKPRHHELPRYYLRSFCAPDVPNHVWVFERGKPFNPGKLGEDNSPRLRGINLAGLHPDGYGAIEAKLQKIEHAADEAIRKVRNLVPLLAADKEAIATYIGLMWRRLKVRENELAPIIDRSAKELGLNDQAIDLVKNGRFRDARNLYREIDWINSPAGRRGLIQDSILFQHRRIHQLLLIRPWRFLKVAAPAYFVTTDSPVVFDRKAGLGTSPLLFPLAATILLQVGTSGTDELCYAGVDVARATELNTMLIAHAHRRVYASRADPWIQQQLSQGCT